MAQASSSVARRTVTWHAYAALTAGIVCIAWSAIWVKLAAIPGPASAFYRCAIASVVLPLIWLPVRRAAAPLPRRRALLLTALGGALFAGDLLLWNTAILATSPATATLFANNAPLWVGLGAWLLFHERLTRSFWIGMALTLLGVGLVLGGDMLHQPHLGRGDLMALGAGVFYAAYLLTTQRVRETINTRTFTSISTLSSAAVLLVACLILDMPLTGYSTQTWLALVGLGVLSHLGGWLAINYALGHIRAAVVSVSLLGQPVLTALFAWLLFGDVLAWYQLVGGAVVLLGIWWVNQRTAVAPQPRQA